MSQALYPIAAGGRVPDEPAPEHRPDAPFWRKPLEALSGEEWESLCDGCGRCCLVKLEDEDTGATYYTDVACALLDTGSCRCSDYPCRQTRIPDCVKLTPESVKTISWLPPTCAYRLVREGRDLPWWHPLVSGRRETVAEAGVAIRGKITLHEGDISPDQLVDRIVTWPDRVPKRAKGGRNGPRLSRPKSDPVSSPPSGRPG